MLCSRLDPSQAGTDDNDCKLPWRCGQATQRLKMRGTIISIHVETVLSQTKQTGLREFTAKGKD
jgi:hypothetical protein